MDVKKFRAHVCEVHSGDDLVLMVDLGIDGLHKKVRARLAGVDTPDAYKAAQDTEAGRVRERVAGLTMDRTCMVELHKTGKGGWLVTLHTVESDGSLLNINDTLAKAGYVYSERRKG